MLFHLGTELFSTANSFSLLAASLSRQCRLTDRACFDCGLFVRTKAFGFLSDSLTQCNRPSTIFNQCPQQPCCLLTINAHRPPADNQRHIHVCHNRL